MKYELKRKTWLQCIIWFVVVVFVSIACMVASTYLPQYKIEKNFKKSVEKLSSEGDYFSVGSKRLSSNLDNFTDALILMTSLDMDNLGSILNNPLYTTDPSPVKSLETFISARNSGDMSGKYVRYWMGFRAPMRVLLTVFDYYEIREILSLSFLILILFMTFFIIKKVDARAGILFALSVIFVKPHIIGLSLQSSCCFLIAFGGMLCVPFVIKKKCQTCFFMVLGMLTLFFDFYTTPLLTFGYPFIFTVLLSKNDLINWKKSLIWLSVWFAGYIGMWFVKLGLTTLFTPINGFENGLSAAAYWNLNGRDLEKYLKDIVEVFKAVIAVTFMPEVLNCIVIGMILYLIYKIKQKEVNWKVENKYKLFILPIIALCTWYIIASKPSIQHMFFQHRTIAMALWAIMLYYSFLFYPIKEKK